MKENEEKEVPNTEQIAIDAFRASFAGTDNSTLEAWWPEGTAACSIPGVSCLLDKRKWYVDAIDWTSRELMGSLPTELSYLSRLRRLGLGKNLIYGKLPLSALEDLTELQHFEVYRNNLTGPLPQDWTRWSVNLKRILVHNNELEGGLHSSICDFPKLKGLDLFSNPLAGTLPSCLDEMTQLQDLQIQQTQLSGTIPIGLCNRASIRFGTPVSWGCDIIACPPLTFSNPKGRQYSQETECLPCPTAVFMGSTQCPLPLPMNTFPTIMPTSTSKPSFSPSITPSHEPSSMPPTFMPSWDPTLAPSAPTFMWNDSSSPTLMPLTLAPSGSPSMDTTEVDESSASPSSSLVATVPPTILFVSEEPSSAPSFDAGAGTNYLENGRTDTSEEGSNWALLVSACVLSLIAMLTVVWARRNGRHWWHLKQELAAVPSNNQRRRTGRSIYSMQQTDYESVQELSEGDCNRPNEEDSVESDSGWNDSESSESDEEDPPAGTSRAKNDAGTSTWLELDVSTTMSL